MEEDKNGQDGFPVFKGLQKPLEFMGIRGRFLTLAAVAIGVSFVGPSPLGNLPGSSPCW